VVSLKRKLGRAIVKKAAQNIVQEFWEDHSMNDFFKWVEKGLAILPFNGQKANIGQILFYFGLALDYFDKLVPALQAIAGVVSPQWAAAIGAVIALVGKIHQVLKAVQQTK